MPSKAFKGTKHTHAELCIYTCIGASMCNRTLQFVFWELILASILKALKHDFPQCVPSLALRGALDDSNMPHPKWLGSPNNPWYEPKTCEKGPKLRFEYLSTSKTLHCVCTACMAFP